MDVPDETNFTVTVDRLDLLTFRIATINKPHMGKGA
jgi:hypothetical protein